MQRSESQHEFPACTEQYAPMPTLARDTGFSSKLLLASTAYAPRTSRHTGSKRLGSSQESANGDRPFSTFCNGPKTQRIQNRTSLEAGSADANVGVGAIHASSTVLTRERGAVIDVNSAVVSAEAAVAPARIFGNTESILARAMDTGGRSAHASRDDKRVGELGCNVLRARRSMRAAVRSHLHSSWSSWHRYPRQPAAQRHCSLSSDNGSSSSNRVPYFPRHTPPFSHLHVPAAHKS